MAHRDEDVVINSVTCVLSSVADRRKRTPSAACDQMERPGDQDPMSATAASPYATGGRINLAFLAEFRRRPGRAKLSRLIDTLTGQRPSSLAPRSQP